MTDISRRDLLLGSGLVLAGSASPLRAAGEWHTATQPQPKALPAWVRSARILIAEGYNPPFYPELQFDPEKAVRLAVDIHANAFRYPAASYYAYFPTRSKYPVHPKLAGDPMRETVRLCRAAGLKTIAYLPVNHPFMDIHDSNPLYPEWQRRDAGGNPFITTHFGFSRYYEGCLNSPLRAEIIELVHEVLDYDFDLVYFDGPYQGMDHREEFCYCSWCRKAFFAATGRDIPAQNGPAEKVIACRRWIDDDVARGTLESLTEIVRGAKGLPVFFNNTSMLSRGWCRSRAISVTDGFMFESAETPEQKLFNLQLGKSTGKSIWTYVGYHSQYNGEHLMDKSIRGWYSYPLDSDDLLMDGAVAFAAGTGMVYWSLSRLYFMDRAPAALSEAQHVRSIFDWMNRQDTLMHSASIASQCGLLVSTQTIEWCSSPSYIAHAYPNGFHGIWRVLQEGSLASEPFLDFSLDRQQLDRYTAIYAANAACLSHAQCAMLADYVAAGGTLIATHLSGLFDEYGRAQTRRPLHNLLGIAFEADEPEEHPDLYLRMSGSDRLVPQDPQIVRFRAADDIEVLATTWDLALGQSLGAAMTRRSYGKGRALYIGSSLEAVYEETRIPAVCATLLALLEPFLAPSRRYRVHAQEGLITQYAEAPSAVLLHLIANTGNKVKKLRVNESYLDLENVPVAVRIPKGRRVVSVHLLRADRPAKFSQADGWVHLVIDRIRIHEAVVVRFA